MIREELSRAVEKAVRDWQSNGGVPEKKHVCTCNISLAIAKELAAAVEARAAEMGVKAVVCVSDAGGHPVLVHSMDGAYLASYDIAVGKAYTVVALKMSTEALSHLAQPGQPLYGIQFTNDGKIVIFGGGEPLERNGKVIGGLGVSGGTAEQDTALAAFGKNKFKEIISWQ